MTAPKPPDNKTLVGLPNELKAILERPRSSPPPLAVNGAQEPQPAAAGQAPLQPKASMDRTLVGIPSEMQAALERALAEQAAGKARVRARPQPVASVQVEVPPTASGPVLRVHAVRTLGVSNASAEAVHASGAPEHGAASARRSAPPRSLPARPGPGHRPPPQQLPPRPQARAQPHERQSAPPSASATQLREGNGSGRASGEAQTPSQPPARRSASVPPLPSQSTARSQPPTRASAHAQPAPSQAVGQPSSSRGSASAQPPPLQAAGQLSSTRAFAPVQSASPQAAGQPSSSRDSAPAQPPPLQAAGQPASSRGSAAAQSAPLQAAGQPSSSRASRTSQPEPAQSRVASGSLGQSQLTSQSELLAQSQITAAPFLAPNAPLNWPPARRRSESLSISRSGTDTRASLARSEADGSPRPTAAHGLASQPIAAEPSVIVTPDEPEPQPELEYSAQHDEYDQDDEAADYRAEAQDTPPKRPVFTLPPGSANTKTRRTKAVVEAAPKRWPAIALIALAVVAFGCVIVLRAPSLLPAPLAAMITPKPKHGPSEQQGEGPSKVATAAAAAVAPLAVKTLETDTAAATSRSLAPPSPTRPPASPPFTSGISAQLEKKAIDHLLADDYPAAKQAYERLRSAEPNRPEFGAMVELLTRASSSLCGQPGQAPCAGAAP